MSDAPALGPAVAGRWYPERPDALAAMVDRLLAEADARTGARRDACALIVPHAGFGYSGAVAAAGFSRARREGVDRVVALGPSHYHAIDGAAVPSIASVYRTPLGDVPLDREAVQRLAAVDGIRAGDHFFDREHALEAEIPFLQRTHPTLSLVPVLVGAARGRDATTRIAGALAPILDDRTLIVVSSDFTHFGAAFGYTPFRDDLPRRIEALDRNAIAAIEAGDADGFADLVDRTDATICGRRAIEVFLRLPRAAAAADLVEYDTSGRMTGTWDHSVSYASIAFPAGRR